MNELGNVRILKITRIAIYAAMAIIGFAGLVMALATASLPFTWAAVITEISKSDPAIQPAGLLPYVLALLALAIVLLGLVWSILRKLIAIIGTVEGDDPFVKANALRLKAIGWLMVAGHIIGIPMAFLASHVGERLHELELQGDFSLTGVLATLLVFILAGVFERGAAMREEIEGTV